MTKGDAMMCDYSDGAPPTRTQRRAVGGAGFVALRTLDGWVTREQAATILEQAEACREDVEKAANGPAKPRGRPLKGAL